MGVTTGAGEVWLPRREQTVVHVGSADFDLSSDSAPSCAVSGVDEGVVDVWPLLVLLAVDLLSAVPGAGTAGVAGSSGLLFEDWEGGTSTWPHKCVGRGFEENPWTFVAVAVDGRAG